MNALKSTVFLLLTIALVVPVGATFIEGVRALYFWNTPTASLTSTLLQTAEWHLETGTLPELSRREEAQAPAVPVAEETRAPDDATYLTAEQRNALGGGAGLLTSWSQILPFIEPLSADCFLFAGDLDNSVREPSLAAWSANPACSNVNFYIHDTNGAKMGLAPEVEYGMGYLNFSLKETPQDVFQQPSLINYDNPAAEDLSEQSRFFIDNFVHVWKVLSVDELGYRRTVPENEAEQVVIVIGDSVPFGAVVSDAETVPSLLQARFPQHRFVNSGIPSSQADDNFYRLQRDLERFGDNVAGVIYFHTHNDFYSTMRPNVVIPPEEAAEAIVGVLEEYGVENALLVAHESAIYTATEIVAQYDEQNLINRIARQRAVMRTFTEAGIPAIDTRDIFYAAEQESSSLYGGAAYLIDSTHFSLAGSKAVAETIAEVVVNWQ